MLGAAVLAGCPAADDAPADTTTSDTAGTDDPSTSLPTSTSTTTVGASTSTGPDPTTADSTGAQGCACEAMSDIEELPAACTDLEVDPVDPTQIGELSGWLSDPMTVVATTHEPYLCTDAPFERDSLQCPCVGWLRWMQLDFAEAPAAVGGYDVTIHNADASCSDTCNREVSSQPDFGVQILAADEDCFIVETVDWEYTVRFYVDRTAC
jgi:hypothetical protein